MIHVREKIVGFIALAGLLLSSVIIVHARPAKAESIDPLQATIAEIRQNVDDLASLKDEVALDAQTKEARKIILAKNTLSGIITLGTLELVALQKQLEGLSIEKLASSDYSFDAVEAYNVLFNTLKYYQAYYASMAKRVTALKSYDEARALAADIKNWRDGNFKPGMERIVGLSLVLRNKDVIQIANSRFEKILVDLKKLKNAKLIDFGTVEGSLNNAVADIKSAEALDAEATALTIKMLKTSPLAKTSGAEEVSDYQRVSNIVKQSFAKIKATYQKFLDLNEQVKKMVSE